MLFGDRLASRQQRSPIPPRPIGLSEQMSAAGKLTMDEVAIVRVTFRRSIAVNRTSRTEKAEEQSLPSAPNVSLELRRPQYTVIATICLM